MSAPDFSIKLGLVGTSEIISGVRDLKDMLGELIEKIKEMSTEAMNYSRVVASHTVSVREADEATSSLIDTVELHRAAARLEQAQIQVTEEQFRALAVAAGQYAQSTGQDITESFVRLTDAVRTASEEGIRDYGISLEGLTTRQSRQDATLRELTRRFGDQRIEIDHTAEAISRLENTWGTAWAEMLSAADRNAGAIREILNGLNAQMQDVANALETQRRSMENVRRMGNEQEMREIEQRLSELGYNPDATERQEAGLAGTIGINLSRAYHRVARTAGAAVRGDIGTVVEENIAGVTGMRTSAERAEAQQLAERLRVLRRRDIADIQAGVAPVMRPEQGRVQAAPSTADIRAGKEASERSEREWQEYRVRQRRAESEKWQQEQSRGRSRGQSATDRQLELKRQAEEAINEVEQMYYDEKEARHQRMLERFDEEREAAEREVQERIRLEEEYNEAVERVNEENILAVEAYQHQLEKTREDQARQIEDLENIGAAMSSMGSIANELGGIMTAVAGENAAATEAMKAVQGAFLIAENIVLAATEIAKAVAAAAEQDYAGAALHGIAAALHIAAAAKAAAELGTGGKSTGASSTAAGASAASASYPERSSPYDRERNEQAQIIVTFNGPITSSRVNEDLQAMSRDSSRRAA